MSGKIFFDVGVCKRGRKCGLCGDKIESGDKYFIYKRWIDEQAFPSQKNVCLSCSESITDHYFINFIKDLHESLVTLRTQR